MKILKEAKKEILPVDFIASFISKSWDEVANLKANISGLKQAFTGTKEIENILEDLLDAYLIAIGQLQQNLEKKDIVIPNKEETLKEELSEKAETVVAKLILDEKEAIENYNAAIEELEDDQVYSKAKNVLNHINEEELEHIEELSNILIDKENANSKEKDDFFIKNRYIYCFFTSAQSTMSVWISVNFAMLVKFSCVLTLTAPYNFHKVSFVFEFNARIKKAVCFAVFNTFS